MHVAKLWTNVQAWQSGGAAVQGKMAAAAE